MRSQAPCPDPHPLLTPMTDCGSFGASQRLAVLAPVYPAQVLAQSDSVPRGLSQSGSELGTGGLEAPQARGSAWEHPEGGIDVALRQRLGPGGGHAGTSHQACATQHTHRTTFG